MKAIKISQLKGYSLPSVFSIVLSFTMIACSKLEPDPSLKMSEEGNLKKVYVQTNGSVLIDINALAGANKNSSFLISTTPSQGTLSDFGSGLYEYKTKSLVSSQDGFVIKVMDGNNVLKSDSVILIIENDPGDLPKGIYPKQDFAFGVTSGARITLDVLANDYLSVLFPDDINISILSGESLPPYFGTTVVNANKIIYTANSSFKSADKIIYKATLKNDTSIFAYGHVYLTAEALCDFKVNDDVKESKEEFTQVRVDGLANDELCKSINSFQVTISKTPAKGTVYLESDQFVYTPTNLAAAGFEDSFEYTVCIDGVCKMAKVTIRVKP